MWSRAWPRFCALPGKSTAEVVVLPQIRSVVALCYSLSMSARILDGLKIRDEIFGELKGEIEKLSAQGIRPGLAAVLVGENPASQLYVKSKIAACEELGLASWLHTPLASVSTEYYAAD